MHSLRVLIVDDMAAMRWVIKEMLEEIGFSRIAEASDAPSAWALLEAASREPNHYFSLVIVDWLMPGASGLDLLKEIRSSETLREIPTLVMTSLVQEERIQEALLA